MNSRTQPPSDRDTEAASFGHVRGRHHRGSGLQKYYTIKAVAEALECSPRTIRRWVANGDLIVHRVNGVVRVSAADLGAFLALHRDG